MLVESNSTQAATEKVLRVLGVSTTVACFEEFFVLKKVMWVLRHIFMQALSVEMQGLRVLEEHRSVLCGFKNLRDWDRWAETNSLQEWLKRTGCRVVFALLLKRAFDEQIKAAQGYLAGAQQQQQVGAGAVAKSGEPSMTAATSAGAAAAATMATSTASIGGGGGGGGDGVGGGRQGEGQEKQQEEKEEEKEERRVRWTRAMQAALTDA